MWRTWEDENWTQTFSQNLKVSGYLGSWACVTGYYNCPSVMIPGEGGLDNFGPTVAPYFPLKLLLQYIIIIIIMDVSCHRHFFLVLLLNQQ
jgi:hypothetical protein